MSVCVCVRVFFSESKITYMNNIYQIQTLIHNEKKKKKRDKRQEENLFSFVVYGRLESKACSNIFKFLRYFACCSIQTFGNHFLFIDIEMIILFTKITIEYILNKQPFVYSTLSLSSSHHHVCFSFE